jgi:hypothetical protein
MHHPGFFAQGGRGEAPVSLKRVYLKTSGARLNYFL